MFRESTVYYPIYVPYTFDNVKMLYAIPVEKNDVYKRVVRLACEDELDSLDMYDRHLRALPYLKTVFYQDAYVKYQRACL